MRNLILALGATAALSGTMIAPAHAQEPTFSAYPAPGTLTASAGTAISFRGAAQTALGTVTVTGSRSGAHPGELRAHPDGVGASFVPSEPFEEGERVTVSTERQVVGAEDGDFSFTIGDATTRKTPPVESPMVGRGSVQSYETRPDLEPPAVTVSTVKAGRTPGYVFIAPKAGRGQDGPMIIDDRGRLVWFKPMKGRIAADFRVQSYQGKPALTWWEGRLYRGDGDGVGQVYDQNYRRVATVRAGNGYSTDLHEFTITPRGTAIVLAYERYTRDLSTWGGPRQGRIVDNIVQEVDLATGLVLFEWHSFGNVSPGDSFIPPPARDQVGAEWEYFHVNAAEVTSDGNFLISARNTSALYKINRATGEIMWTLGGKQSDFKLGRGAAFAFQHSSRTLGDGTISLYDNSAAPPVRKASRVLRLRLDEQAKTATVVSAFTHPRNLLSASQGNVEQLPNGNTFVGWGSQRWFTELSPTGEVVFDGRIALGNDSYRAFRFPWSGRPAVPPKVVAVSDAGRITARVSWNGATGVARWQLLAGPSADQLTPVGERAGEGFETAMTVQGSQPFVALRAFDAAGNALVTSPAVRPQARD